MNYDLFDNDAEISDADYSAFVQWLSEQTATQLRQAKDETEQQKQALCCYWKRGLRANLTPGELIDFLGVSASCILDRVGYTDDEGDAIMAISDGLTDEDINQATLS